MYNIYNIVYIWNLFYIYKYNRIEYFTTTNRIHIYVFHEKKLYIFIYTIEYIYIYFFFKIQIPENRLFYTRKNFHNRDRSHPTSLVILALRKHEDRKVSENWPQVRRGFTFDSLSTGQGDGRTILAVVLSCFFELASSRNLGRSFWLTASCNNDLYWWTGRST